MVVVASTTAHAQSDLPQILPTQTLAPVQGSLPVGLEDVRLYPSGVPHPAGDVNGDGRSDVVYVGSGVADPSTANPSDAPGQTLVYYGPALNLAPDQIVAAALKPVGDVDLDGYADAYSTRSDGTLLLHRGGPGGYGAPAVREFEGGSVVPDGLLAQSRGFADLDGDARADLVVQELGGLPSGIQFLIFYGSGDSLSVRVPLSDELVAAGETSANYAGGFLLLDLDADGRDEIVFPERSSTQLVVRAVGVSAQEDVTLQTLAGLTPPFEYVRGRLDLWDIDGDLNLDIILESSFVGGDRPIAYLSGADGFGSEPVSVENRVRLVGDLDGDAIADGLALAGQTVSDGVASFTVYLGPAELVDGQRLQYPNRASLFVEADADGEVGLPEARSSDYGDIDGDGDTDTVVSLKFLDVDRVQRGFGRLVVTDVAAESRLQAVRYAGDAFPASNVRLTAGLGDLNGDGIDDVGLVQSPTTYRPESSIEVYYGGSAIGGEPSLTLTPPFTRPLATITDLSGADFDGDGGRDIVAVLRSNEPGLSLNVAVWFSEGGAIDVAGGWVYFCQAGECLQSGNQQGLYNLTVGDVDGDGVDDIVAGGGRAIVLKGGAGPMGDSFEAFPGDRISFEADDNVNGRPERVLNAGDLDGDGADDILLCDLSRCTLALGSPGAPFASSTLELIPAGSARLPGISATAGDFNGDGFPDVAIVTAAQSGPAATNVYHGGPGLDATPDAVIDLSVLLKPGRDTYTGEVTAVPDMNGDGTDELLFGGEFSTLLPARATILAGGTYEPLVELVAPNASVPLGASNNSILSATSSAVGDFDGDGFADVLLPRTNDTNLAPESSQLSLFPLRLGAVSSEPTASEVVVRVGPNPVRGVMRVTLDAPEAAEVFAELFDPLGRRVVSVSQGIQGRTQRLQISAATLAAGVYVLRVTSGDHQHVQSISVVR